MPDVPLYAAPSSQLVDHLFRHEAGRMASVLTCLLGFDQIELAEDIVQETMVQALQSWPFQGIPDNPRAWLYRVAKNKALDVVRRESRFRQICSEVEYLHQQESVEAMVNQHFFTENAATSRRCVTGADVFSIGPIRCPNRRNRGNRSPGRPEP